MAVRLLLFSHLFQFHKGTIRTSDGRKTIKGCSCFNSIKVRLEPNDKCIPSFNVKRFQFHKGTIRTHQRIGGSRAGATFQFHKGTIRTKFYMVNTFIFLSFNSIKVRLERVNGVNVLSLLLFQFHKGTIRTSWIMRLIINTRVSIP